MFNVLCYSIAGMFVLVIAGYLAWELYQEFRKAKVAGVIANFTICQIEIEEQHLMSKENADIIRTYSKKLVDQDFKKWQAKAKWITSHT